MTNANEHNGRSLKLNMHLVATYQDARFSGTEDRTFCC